MENVIIDRLAHWGMDRLSGFINIEDYDPIDIKKMILGIELFIINISKAIIIYGCALLFGNVLKTLAIHFAFIVTKKFSFGLHAKNSTVCTLYCIGILVLLPLLTQYFTLNNYLVALIFAVIIFLHFRYAPADTQARPLLGVKRRERFKRLSVLCVTALMAISLIIPSAEVKTLFVMGSVCQTLSILPITYKILRRSVRNYEKYEL